MASAYLDASLTLRDVGAREDFGGTPMTDLSAEEDRYSQIFLTEGALTPLDSFLPVKGSSATMDLKFGSGAAKTDYYVVEGDDPGQGNYVARLAAAQFTVVVDAADPSQARTDEVYIVVRDDAYDSLGTGLATWYYAKGTPGGGAPGPLGTWEAYALLATCLVPASAADIDACTLTDNRVASGIKFGDSEIVQPQLDGDLEFHVRPAGLSTFR